MGMSLLLSAGASTENAHDDRDDGAAPAPVPEPGPLNPEQHARDVVAIVKAMGREKTSLFGSSLGALIALECAASYPSVLDAVIVHEAPAAGLLPDATALLDWLFELHALYRTEGHRAAGQAWQGGRIMPGHNAEVVAPLADAREEDMENFWKYEFLSSVLYCPDLVRIVENGVSVLVAVGEESGDAFDKRAGGPLAKSLGCECLELPGGHYGFENYAEEAAGMLVNAFKSIEERRARN
jgi:pimeloyl-ACP methyl ester carboxylesterase